MSVWSALMGDGTFGLEVVGVASCQPELEEICQGDPQERIVLAVLILDDTNPSDPRTVRVQIWQRTVGYLRPADATAFRAWLGRDAREVRRFRCRAKLQRTILPLGGEGWWTVHLDICLPQA
jgi:hypothetical protein